MLVIPVPTYIYLPFLCGISVIWVGWVVSDVYKKGISKYSRKRILQYVVSGVVVGLLWSLFLA